MINRDWSYSSKTTEEKKVNPKNLKSIYYNLEPNKISKRNQISNLA